LLLAGNIKTQPMISPKCADYVTTSFKNRWRALMSVDDVIADTVRRKRNETKRNETKRNETAFLALVSAAGKRSFCQDRLGTRRFSKASNTRGV
jgi:hypothetical protein